jgi:hypothetical protein
VHINWDQLGQPKFDRTVEALIRRRFKDASTVTVVDGRGGDDGIDILLVTHDGHRRILQLKYFPETFSSGWADSRRPQIKKSYKTAIEKNQPDEWTLVVPRLLTTPERKFVENLNSGSTPPAIRIVNRTALDDWLADDPDLDKYLQRDPETALREMARTYRDRTVRVRDLRTGGNTRVIRLGVSVLWVTKPQNDLVVAGHAAGLTALRI